MTHLAPMQGSSLAREKSNPPPITLQHPVNSVFKKDPFSWVSTYLPTQMASPDVLFFTTSFHGVVDIGVERAYGQRGHVFRGARTLLRLSLQTTLRSFATPFSPRTLDWDKTSNPRNAGFDGSHLTHDKPSESSWFRFAFGVTGFGS